MPRRRSNKFPPLLVILTGMAIAIFGYLRAAQPLTHAPGIITEAAATGGYKSSVWLTVHYKYQVSGRDYAGHAFVRNLLVSDAPYQPGREIPVFFVSSTPERSYAFERPMALPWILGGTILVMVGGIILFFSWNA